MTDICIFCQIAKKRIEAQVVFEDEDILAFHDINPVAPVHILLIPKQHIPSVLALTEENSSNMGHLMSCIPRIAHQFSLEKGFKLLFNTGPFGGQIVEHIHAHIIGDPNGIFSFSENIQ